MHTVRSLAKLVEGEVKGPGSDLPITGVNDLRSAQPDQVSFLANPKYAPQARQSRAGAVVLALTEPEDYPFTQIRVASPSLAFEKISQLFLPPPVTFTPGVHPSAVVAPDAVLGDGVSIQPHVVIEPGVKIGARSVIGAGCYLGHGSVIGADCLLYPRVTLRERSLLGARIIIHSGAVIGADGFGYEMTKGRHVKIAQNGFVQIDDDAEIGANTTIDRGRFGRTHIGEGVKIDNLVQIAHNVVIGAHSIIVSQAGISGSTTLGKYVTIAGQVGIVGHINLGDRSAVTAQSGVSKDVPEGTVVSGHHAIPMRESLKLEALVRRLPEILDRLKALEKKSE